MNAYMVLVNQTQIHDFYCVYFDKYCTGTTNKEKANKLIDWLKDKEKITLQELKKAFRYSSVGLYYKKPLKRIF